jgi:VWFA-related protein
MKSRNYIRPLLTVCLILAAASTVAASDPYANVVKHLETDYHAKKTHIPFIGLGNFVLKFWHPAGVKSIKLSVFEDQTLYPRTSGDRFDSLVEKAAGGKWRPIVREFSRKDNQWTYVYYNEGGKDTRILVVSLDQKDAVVAQVKFEPGKLVEFIQNPRLLGHSLARDIRTEAENPGQASAGIRDSADDEAEGQALTPVSTSDPEADPKVNAKPDLIRNQRTQEAGYSEDASIAPSPEPDKAIRLEAKLVNLNVIAVDRAGLAVPNLHKEDFAVLEDGVKQDIAFFETNNAPVNLMLLLDLSGSTRKKIKLIKEAAAKFVDSLAPTDKVAVAAFTRRFYSVSDFTADHKVLKDRISKTKNLEGGTAYYDAMWIATNLLDRAGASRKALVVMTDGVDNYLLDPKEWSTKHQFSDVLNRISEDDITVYPIYLDTEIEEIKRSGTQVRQAYTTARQQLLALAEQTGGTMLKAVTDDDLSGAYQQIAAQLHSLYSLAYAPKDLRSNGRWREIQVRTSRTDVAVTAKRGFLDK